MAAHGKEHVTRAGGAEAAAGAIDRGYDVGVEGDDLFSAPAKGIIAPG